MPTKALVVAALVVIAVAASFFLGRMFPASSSKHKAAASLPAKTQSLHRTFNDNLANQKGLSIPDNYVVYTTNGVSWLCPKDNTYAKTFGEGVLRQLQGRFIERNGHLYLKVSNSDYIALIDSHPNWSVDRAIHSVIYDVTNINLPCITDGLPVSEADKLNGVQWRGGFAMNYIYGRFELNDAATRIYNTKTRLWSQWMQHQPELGAAGELKHNTWSVHWSIHANFGVGPIYLDPYGLPDAAFDVLFSKPFFLLPISESDIPR